MAHETESVQLTLFLREPNAASAFDLWEKASSNRPTGFSSTPGSPQSQAQGRLGEADAILIVGPARVDLVLRGIALTTPTPIPACLIDPETVRADGLRFLGSIIKELRVGRTACVMQAHVLADSSSSAVAKLRELLPNTQIPSDTDEVVWQLTSSLKSQTNPSKIIKQMRRWQTASLQLLQVGGSGSSAAMVTAETYAAIIHIDVFHPNMETLAVEQAMASLEEVSSLALSGLQDGIEHAPA